MKINYRIIMLAILGIISATDTQLFSMEKCAIPNALELTEAQATVLKRCALFKDVETITRDLTHTITGNTDLQPTLISLAALIDNPALIGAIEDGKIAALYYTALFTGAPQQLVELLGNRYFNLLKKRKVGLLNSDSATHYIPLCATPFRYGLPIKWDTQVSERTISSSWHNWRDRYTKVKPELAYLGLSQEVLEKHLKEAISNGTYETWFPENFLTLSIEYSRLTKVPHAKTPEEAYPPSKKRTIEKRRRDLAKVYSLLGTVNTLSPVVIAKAVTTTDDKNPVLIKLDGGHRIVAARFRNSPVAVCFINLSFQQFLVNQAGSKKQES